MLEYISLPVHARKENSVHIETFSFNAVFISFCNQWFANAQSFPPKLSLPCPESSLPPLAKLSFPGPEKKKMNVSSLYPKLGDFS